jgi:hypothetical protein
MKRQVIDFHQRKKRAEEEIVITKQEMVNFLSFLTNQHKLLQDHCTSVTDKGLKSLIVAKILNTEKDLKSSTLQFKPYVDTSLEFQVNDASESEIDDEFVNLINSEYEVYGYDSDTDSE